MPALSLLLALLTVHADTGDAVRYAHLKDEIAAATDLQKAKPAMEEAVKIYAQDGDLWRRLGQARPSRQKSMTAESTPTKRRSKLGALGNKFKAGVYYDLACAYSLKGDKTKGFEFLGQSLDAGFRDLQHLREDTDLTLLHDDKRWIDLAATKDVTKMSRDEGWRYDLWLMNREVSRVHLNPIYPLHQGGSKRHGSASSYAEIPKLTGPPNRGRVYGLHAQGQMICHRNIRPGKAATNPSLPIQLGHGSRRVLMVTGAYPEFKDLLGAKIEKVAGRPIGEVMAKLSEIIPKTSQPGCPRPLPGGT